MTERGIEPVLEQLKQGNARFQERVRAGEFRGAELARGQQPHAIVLACADSRVVPEIAFDAHPGELFVVRVAGNVANRASIASIEFAVANLGAPLVIVMAHEDCGAVRAALEGGEASKNLSRLLRHISDAVDQSPDRDVDAIARHNARLNAQQLTIGSEILRKAVEEERLRIATAFFHLATGAVEFDAP